MLYSAWFLSPNFTLGYPRNTFIIFLLGKAYSTQMDIHGSRYKPDHGSNFSRNTKGYCSVIQTLCQSNLITPA